MTVRAVTPRIPAIHGLVHRHDCAGDCCNFDADQDDLAVGDPYDPEWPDKPVRFSSHRGRYAERTRERVEPTPMNGTADHRVGSDGRSAVPTSSTTVGAPQSAGTSDGVSLAAGTSDGPLAEPATSLSSLVAGRETLEDVSPSGGHRPGS